MTLPIAAWRVTYTPGDWLVLSGPTALAVMLPAPARMSPLVNRLWDDIVAARSLDALLSLFAEYGLDSMPDFAAFFWDEAGLHGMARGAITVVDTGTGETVVAGAGAITWSEKSLGHTRHLRVDMDVHHAQALELPLVVGAVCASAIHLSTDPASRVRFPAAGQVGVVPQVPVLQEDGKQDAEPPAGHGDAGDGDAGDLPVDVVGLGDESEMEPYAERGEEVAPQPGTDLDPDPVAAAGTATEPEPAPDHTPEPEPAPSHSPEPEPAPSHSPEPEAENENIGAFRFDAEELLSNQAAPPAPPQVPGPGAAVPIPPPASLPSAAPAVTPGNFQVGDEGGTIFSTGLAATHKPAAAASEEQQVLAVPCARGHANAPGSRTCRLCSAPVDSSTPRLIARPVLAGVHSNQGDFTNLDVAVLVGRSPDAAKAPPGAHLLRVPSPSSDISRSHLMVTSRDWSIIVTDLNSTNGTTIIPVGEQPFVLANGDSVQVDLGTVLDLGDGVSLRIEGPRG